MTPTLSPTIIHNYLNSSNILINSILCNLFSYNNDYFLTNSVANTCIVKGYIFKCRRNTLECRPNLKIVVSIE